MGSPATARSRAGWALSAFYLRRIARPRLRTPDRIILEERIFPSLYRDTSVHRILFVGVSEFTSWYPAFFRTRKGLAFETADPRRDASRFGARGAHWETRFEELREHRPPYDVIVLNGIFEYGTEGEEEKRASIAAAREMLTTGGLLLLGYRDREPAADIDVAVVGASGFEEAPIPGLGLSRYRTQHPNGHTYAGFSKP
jgi:hypothetical protein